jgi:predicted transcriptional regulator
MVIGMSRPKSDVLTEREAQIMQILWDRGQMTSVAIGQVLPGDPHDSSVRTMLRVLIQKGYVRVDNGQRPAVYTAAVPQARLRKKATHSLLQRFFSGSAEDLVQHLLEGDQLTPEQLTKLRRKYGSQRRESQ